MSKDNRFESRRPESIQQILQISSLKKSKIQSETCDSAVFILLHVYTCSSFWNVTFNLNELPTQKLHLCRKRNSPQRGSKKTSARQHIYTGKSTQKPLPNSPSLRRSRGQIPHPQSGLSSILHTTKLERSSSWRQDGEKEEPSHLSSKDVSEVSHNRKDYYAPQLDSAARHHIHTSYTWTARREEHLTCLTNTGKKVKDEMLL